MANAHVKYCASPVTAATIFTLRTCFDQPNAEYDEYKDAANGHNCGIFYIYLLFIFPLSVVVCV
jgi:hypothetical protein